MPDKKSIVEEIEDKAVEIGRNIKETLDEIAADEDPPKFELPDDEKNPSPVPGRNMQLP